MVRLDRAMMERYEIEDRRPKALRAVLFGLDAMMLCGAARLLDSAGIGAVCVTGSDEAQALREQDGMFTLLIRGEGEDGSPLREERVVQSILEVADPDGGADYALRPEVDLFMLPALVSAEDFVAQVAVLVHYLRLRWEAKLAAPRVLLLERMTGAMPELRACVAGFAARVEDAGFADWLEGVSFQSLLVDSLFGQLSDSDFAKAQREMNYQDRFLLWTEPQLACTPSAALPEELATVCSREDYALACARKERVFDSLVFLCAVVGFLSGMDTFAQVLRDEKLRAFIGNTIFNELLPALPWPREKISPHIISAFFRLENSMNDVPLLQESLMSGFSRTLLPSIRAHAEQDFKAPPRLTLAFSAAIMIYAGARKNGDSYEVLRGKDRFVLRDAPDVLESFSLLAHDMPAETLAYAVLADRALWGGDLREIDGLELRVSLDISSIQRVGFRETLRLREEG